MKDRLVQLLEKERITSAEFADRIGVQRSNVSHILNGRNNPGFSFIQKVLETFPRVNSRWMITGEGEMYTDRQSPLKSVSANLFSNSDDRIAEQKPKNNVLTERPKDSVVELPETMPAPPKQTITPNQPLKKVVRVMLFYDDYTFDDFSPTDKM
jgi:transcriptional regulator with XRE-family HTH domain